MDPPSRFCGGCDEALPGGVQASACPRCGREYDPHDPLTFRTTPRFRAVRYWLPGLSLAVIAGVASYAVILRSDSNGVALFLAVPVSVGAVLGYGARARTGMTLVLCVLAVSLVAFALVALGFAGLFCGAVGAAVLVVPALLGVLLGTALRVSLKISRWSQRFYLPLAALVALPHLADRIERMFPRPSEIATVETRALFEVSGRRAFDGIVFFEEVKHQAPLLLRLALPRPVRSEGRKTADGDVVRCVYEHGYLKKRITRVEPGRLLAFEVIEQNLHFERDVALLDGSFAVAEAEGADRGPAAWVIVTTRYRPLLHPRWLWSWMEVRIVHALHEHVLEGMRREAQRLPERSTLAQPQLLGVQD
jgi:hypothetical protein